MDINFDNDVEVAIKLYEEVIGQSASRTRQMIEMYGKIEAISKLMVSSDLQKGFKILRDKGLLDKTFESIVIKHKKLFKPYVLEAAAWRLQEANQLLDKM